MEQTQEGGACLLPPVLTLLFPRPECQPQQIYFSQSHISSLPSSLLFITKPLARTVRIANPTITMSVETQDGLTRGIDVEGRVVEKHPCHDPPHINADLALNSKEDLPQDHGLLHGRGQLVALDKSLSTSIFWMIVNTLATIAIVSQPHSVQFLSRNSNKTQVFTNKAIFTESTWRLCQLSFASFHFFVTWLTLYILSRPRFAYFTPRRVSVKNLLPLAIAMCLNVILPNLCLAYSSITFYQIARILLTPTVAMMNFFLYGATLPQKAILALIPTCLGVGMVSYYDSLPTEYEGIKTTSSLGVIFAFTGIFASSLYTVWIGSYHRKLQLSSMQLLHNQAPVACFLLLYGIPFLDVFPEWDLVPFSTWLMIFLVRTHPLIIEIYADKNIVRRLRLFDQHLSILHRCPDWTGYQHSRRAS